MSATEPNTSTPTSVVPSAKKVLLGMKSTFKSYISSIEGVVDSVKPSMIVSAIIQVANEAHTLVGSISISTFAKEIANDTDELMNFFKSEKIGSGVLEQASSFSIFAEGQLSELENYIQVHLIKATQSCMVCSMCCW